MRQADPDSARRSSLLLWAVAFFLWVAFIWGHSLIQGPQSTLESDAVVSVFDSLFCALGICDPEVMTMVVRKGAHVMEYAVLGFLARGMLCARLAERGRPILPAGLLVALVPALDECLQLFVPGRSGTLSDVCIDLLGVCLGAFLGWLWSRLLCR